MEGKSRQASQPSASSEYAWKQRAYPAPGSSSRRFQWKAAALRGLEHLGKAHAIGQPVTIVVPALFNSMPAEAVALGWLNDIDALLKIRNRMQETSRLTGWDVFTFHTQHNLDKFFNSNIAVVRDTWLREGSLSAGPVAEALRRFGRPYEYHRIEARLVENFVLQVSLLEWLTDHAADSPLRFHVCGTALLSALVWSGAISLESAIQSAVKTGARWDHALDALVEKDLARKSMMRTDGNHGWLRFHRVRELIEGRATLPFKVRTKDLPPPADAPARPFWFSPTSKDEPVLIQTTQDVRAALETLSLDSWSPAAPKPLGNDSICGWLASALHPAASACRWSVHNYLLATPASTLLFLRHIAELGRTPVVTAQPELLPSRLRLSRMKVTQP
jgi:hypothetical protein